MKRGKRQLKKKINMVNEKDIIPTVFENWTSARMVTRERELSEHCSFHINRIEAGPWSKETMDPSAEKANYLIGGEAEVAFDGKLHQWRVGACLYVPPGMRYRIHPKTDIVVAVIQSPPRLRSDWEGHPALVVLEPNDISKQ